MKKLLLASISSLSSLLLCHGDQEDLRNFDFNKVYELSWEDDSKKKPAAVQGKVLERIDSFNGDVNYHKLIFEVDKVLWSKFPELSKKKEIDIYFRNSKGSTAEWPSMPQVGRIYKIALVKKTIFGNEVYAISSEYFHFKEVAAKNKK